MRLLLSALSLLVASTVSIVPCMANDGSNSGGGNVTYKPAGEATMHYKDGVTVRRHADGSVEVSEPESREELYPAQRPAVRRVKHVVHKKKATTAKTTTSTAKTAKQHK